MGRFTPHSFPIKAINAPSTVHDRHAPVMNQNSGDTKGRQPLAWLVGRFFRLQEPSRHGDKPNRPSNQRGVLKLVAWSVCFSSAEVSPVLSPNSLSLPAQSRMVALPISDFLLPHLHDAFVGPTHLRLFSLRAQHTSQRVIDSDDLASNLSPQ